MGPLLRGDSTDLANMDRSFVQGSRLRLPRKGHRIPTRDGRSRPFWAAMPEVWRKGSAHSLRRQRNQRLCALPNGRKTSCGPEFVEVIRIGLAADARGTRKSEAPLARSR